MINDFTLFNISILNLNTWEFEDQGSMRAFHARKFVYEMEVQQIPTMVESTIGDDNQDMSFFMEYLTEGLEDY